MREGGTRTPLLSPPSPHQVQLTHNRRVLFDRDGDVWRVAFGTDGLQQAAECDVCQRATNRY